MQVTIGSPDLKANHAIRQHVDIISESQKYNKYCGLDIVLTVLVFFSNSCLLWGIRYSYLLIGPRIPDW